MAERPVADDSIRSRASDELRLLYAWSLTEIANFKQQQWSVTNYALLLYAAIAAVAKLVAHNSGWLRVFLGIFTLVVAIAAWYVISTLNRAIRVRRRRLKFVRQTFTPEFIKAWCAAEPEETFEAEKERDLQIFQLVFRTVLGAGALVTILLLSSNSFL